MQPGELSYQFRVAGWKRIKAIDPSAIITSDPSPLTLTVESEVPPDDLLRAYLLELGWEWSDDSPGWTWNCPIRAKMMLRSVNHDRTDGNRGRRTTVRDIQSAEGGDECGPVGTTKFVIDYDDFDPIEDLDFR